MKKRIFRGVVIAVVIVAALLVGGSLYLLRYSLQPQATIEAKNASSYKYMYEEYPFLRPWVDSLRRAPAGRI